MPWRIKKELILLLLGCGAIIIGAVVLILNRDNINDLLAIVAVLGGGAIIINSLPSNGNGKGSGQA